MGCCAAAVNNVAHRGGGGPPGLAGHARQVDAHGHVVERPAEVVIGRPARRPPDALLAKMGRRVAACGATSAYWFWMSVGGERPHLGLAVAPDDDAVVAAVGAAVEPLWREASPGNPTFDVLRLGSTLDGAIRAEGEVLVP